MDYKYGVYGASVSRAPRSVVSVALMLSERPALRRRFGMTAFEAAQWLKRQTYSKRDRLVIVGVKSYVAKAGPGGRRKRRMRRRAK